MNYEKLTKLAELLNSEHGDQDRHGFIVAPHSETQFNNHKNALLHTGRIFNYQPISDEKLGIYSVTRDESADYTHVPLEHTEYDALATEGIRPLLNEYLEFAKSRV